MILTLSSSCLQFLLQIQMSQLKLTKIVTIMPFFVVVNNTSHSLRYMEENEQADLWHDIEPNEVHPYWPSTDSMKMCVKHKDSNVSSQHFWISANHRTTLRMDKGVSGISSPREIYAQRGVLFVRVRYVWRWLVDWTHRPPSRSSRMTLGTPRLG